MNFVRANLVGILFAVMANAAVADLKPAVEPHALGAMDSVSMLLAADEPMHELSLWPSSTAGEQARAMSFDLARLDGADEAVIREIRKRPSSLSLYLSLLFGVGGWHFVRSARHFNMAAAPDWYHTGGPIQVGHVTPFDFSFGTPAICFFELPVVFPSSRRLRLDEGVRLDPQACLPLAAPRGPPPSA